MRFFRSITFNPRYFLDIAPLILYLFIIVLFFFLISECYLFLKKFCALIINVLHAGKYTRRYNGYHMDGEINSQDNRLIIPNGSYFWKPQEIFDRSTFAKFTFHATLILTRTACTNAPLCIARRAVVPRRPRDLFIRRACYSSERSAFYLSSMYSHLLRDTFACARK